jgi:hypothetical protein
VNDVGAETPVRVSDPDEETGRALVTKAGTVKAPALAGAVQLNIAPPPCAKVEFPDIYTNPFGSPPVHITVTPWERSTLVTLAALVQTIGGGAVSWPWKAPTSAPPGPLDL